MAPSIRILRSNSTNPWFNLATEDWIFRELDPHIQTLFLWRNSDSVVIGRHQNPWLECDLRKMEEDDVLLARRQSGGGAVFHDLGNTNFTFLSDRDGYNQDDDFGIVLDALSRLGINGERSGRNDILVESRKISGNAFKHTKERSFHHGTLLIKANLARLKSYLQPGPKRLESKGIKSVRSPVVNLTELIPDLDHDRVCDALQDAFFSLRKSTCTVEMLDTDTLRNIPTLSEYYQLMAGWEWRFGKTPDFTHQLGRDLSGGTVEVNVAVSGGTITEATVHSDALSTDLSAILETSLTGIRYDRREVHDAVSALRSRRPNETSRIEEIIEWLPAAL